MRDLVLFVQFKNVKKHSWRCVTFSNTPQWVFFTFFKLYKWYQIAQNIASGSRDMLKFNFSEKGLGLVSPQNVCVWFFKNDVSHITDQISFLIAFTSRDTGQYEYYICLSTRLGRHKNWNQPNLSNQAVLPHDQKVKTKTYIFWERKELLRWNKKYF